jgi:hypothetical protein
VINEPLQKRVLLPPTLVAKVHPSDNDPFQDTAGRIVLDQRESGEVRSKQENTGFFSNTKTVLYLLGLVGGDTGAFAGPRVPPLIGQRAQHPRKGKTAA